jgi:hypothetical protein
VVKTILARLGLWFRARINFAKTILTGLWLWLRSGVNVVLRRDSLRRLSNAEIDKALGSRGRANYLWNTRPRLITFAVAIGAVLIALIAQVMPWSGWVGRPFQVAAIPPSLIAVTTGLWGVEAILFGLTAAITALLVNIAADPNERSSLMERYRSKAFDAVAVLGIAIILLTGDALRVMLEAEVVRRDVSGIVVRTGLLFVFDVLALYWLLYYSHRLITRAGRERTQELLEQLRDSLRDAVMRDVSGTIFEAWGLSKGLAVASPLIQDNAFQVRAPRAGYLHDVALDRLELWLRSLEHPLTVQPAIRAQAQIRLNVDVSQGSSMAAIAPADAGKGSKLLRALRWKREVREDPFPLALAALRDSSSVAARSGLLGEFRGHLAELHALQAEVFRLSPRAQGLVGQMLTYLMGWHPTMLVRNTIGRLGRDVLLVESRDVIGTWLYFPQKLIVETRQYDQRDLGSLFVVWEQVAARGKVPQEWEFWLRLSEYTGFLNTGLQAAGSADALAPVVDEAFGLLLSFRNMIVRLDRAHFPAISKAVERIGRVFLVAWNASPTADGLAAARRAFANEFFKRKRVFWLGYAGWLFRNLAQQHVAQSEVTTQWETIRQHFHSLNQLWQAWRVLGDADPFKWDFEESYEWKAPAEAEGKIAWGGTPDPFASATVPFILLGLTLAPASAMAPDDQARALLETEIQPHMTQMLAEGEPKWEPFVGHMADRSLADRMNVLRQRIQDLGNARAQGTTT